jgi:Mg2+ and Co2+ transporter CorA
MRNVIKDVDTGGIGVFGSPDIAGLPCGVDEKLLRHYLQRLQPMHVRRTLDQFGYYTIADTASRDKDQVVDRYSRAHHTTDLIVPPMLMVDQCWLWILGNNTVLTCFPHRWNRSAQSDSTDVYESILEILDDPLHRNKVQNAGQLASVIIDRCAGNVLDRDLIKDEHLRFLDFFDWSIDDLNERQSQCLQALWQDVQDSRHGGDAEGLTDISKEFDVLEKIKDIIDELQIVLRLIDQQQHAFSMVLHNETSKQLTSPDTHSGGTNTPVNQVHTTNSTKLTEYVDFQRLEDSTRGRAEGIRTMIDRANATYNATLDVLSLKNSQANISEARSSRLAAESMNQMAIEAKKSAEESEKQSYSIMLFIIVTIFFLPMSSIASIFGVNAKEFGQGTVHLSTIFAYVIPISVFVVYMSFFLAFNHKARRSLLLCAQILRAYINLALPVVFDEEKESRLQKKLRELKDKRHMQRNRKAARIQEAEEAEFRKVKTTSVPDDVTEEAEQQKEESVYSAPDFAAFQRERSRFNSVASMGVFGWRGNKQKESNDPEGRPVPSRMSSYGQNAQGGFGVTASRRPTAV